MRKYQSFYIDQVREGFTTENEYEIIKQNKKLLTWLQTKLIEIMIKLSLIKKREAYEIKSNVVEINCNSVMDLIYKTLDQEMYNSLYMREKFTVVMGLEYFHQLKLEPQAQYRIRQEIKMNGNMGLYVDDIEIILTPRTKGMFLLET